MENIFILRFLEAPASYSFFSRLAEKCFSTKSFIPAGGNGFLNSRNRFLLLKIFFLFVEMATEINGGQFLNKDQF